MILTPTTRAPKNLIPRGVNVAGYGYYQSSMPLIDLMRGTTNAWTGSGVAAVDSLGWIINLPTGQYVSKYLVIHMRFKTGYVRPGRYAYTWSNPNLVMQNDGGMSSNPVLTTGRYEFDIPAMTEVNSGNLFIVPRLTNNSGSPQSENNIKCFHLNDEADMLAGRLFQRSFLQSIEGASYLRFMDWMSTNNSTLVDFSEYPTEAHCTWNPMPPSVIGKLLAQTGLDGYITLNPRNSQACMDAWSAALAAQIIGTGVKVYCAYSNEDWNAIFSHSNWVRDVKSVGLTIVDNAGNPASDNASKLACAHAHGSLQAWSSLEKVLPRSRVIRVYEGQAANFSALAAGFEYTDPGIISTGQKLKALVDAYSIAPYFYATISGTGNPIPVDMTIKAQRLRKDYLQPDSWWIEAFKVSIANSSGWVTASKAAAQAKRADIGLISYELGQHVWFGRGYTENYTATLTSSVIDFGATDISAAFEDGEQLSFAYNALGVAFAGGAAWTGYYLRKSSATTIRVYANLSDYTNDIPVTLNTGFGTWNIDNLTRTYLLGDRTRQFFDSGSGASVYDIYFNAMAAAGLTNFTQFVQAGGYGSTYYAGINLESQWGLKRSQWEPDANYGRAAWFRALK